MKNILLSIALLLSALHLWSQADQPTSGFNYQAVIRNAQGNPIVGQSVTLRFQILSSPNQTANPSYEEIQTVITGSFGEVALVVGAGTPDQFDTIQWYTGKRYLQVSMQVNGAFQQLSDAKEIVHPPFAEGKPTWMVNGANVFRLDGNVGFRTNNPLSPLFVKSKAFGKNGGVALRSLDVHTVLNNTGMNGSNASFLQVYAEGNENSIGSKPYTFLLQPEGGRVGINSFSAASALTLKSNLFGKTGGYSLQSLDAHLAFYYVDNNGGNNPVIQSWAGGNGDIMGNNAYNLLIQPEGGGVSIGSFAPPPPNTALYINGSTSTKCLTIVGGCDITEPFPNAQNETLIPGSVVVIDEDHPGMIRLATSAYDTKVAGVISGAGEVKPGLSLSQAGVLDNGQQMALAGRVYVRVSASNGPIRPGDLLTTSDLPGVAMKATDRDRSQGTVLGKAMSRLDSGEGLVLVLVGLQ